MQKQVSKRTEQFIEHHGVILFIWVVFTVLNVLRSAPKLFAGILPGNDDNMRMVQIRDWLGGQNWFDLHQYRLNPSEPLLSHWSRFTDILVGLPVKLLTPILGAENAELVAVIAIPSLLMLALLYLLVNVTRYLFDSRGLALATVFIACLSVFAASQFMPGRIDHHGLQIVLALSCLLCILKSEAAPEWAAMAGIFAGLGLSTGIESALYVGAACVAMTMNWVCSEYGSRRRMRAFGIALALSAALMLVISHPVSSWGVPACDALSIVFLFLTLMVALTMVLLSALGTKIHSSGPRFLMAGLLGGGSILMTVIMFPQCLQGPYAEVDPRLAGLWLANVSEAGTVFKALKGDVFTGAAALTLPLLALIGWYIYHKYEGSGFSPVPRTIAIFVLFCTLGGFIQIRLIAFATAMAIPLSAFLILYVFRHTESLKRAKKLLIRALVVIFATPLTLPFILDGLLAKPISADNEKPAKEVRQARCVGASALAAVNELDPGFSITQIDLGAPILKHTALSVSSAPYHRNAPGNLLGFDVFLSNAEEAQHYARKANANYIILCSDFPETDLLLKHSPDGLAAQLIKGQTPDWLTEIQQPESSSLLVYKIAK